MRCEHCHLAEATGHFRHCPKWTPDTHAEVESHVDRLVRWAEEADNAGFYEYAWKFSEAANHIESLNSENTRLRALLRVVAEEDLDADAADGVTVLQAVIKEARDILAIKEKIE